MCQAVSFLFLLRWGISTLRGGCLVVGVSALGSPLAKRPCGAKLVDLTSVALLPSTSRGYLPPQSRSPPSSPPLALERVLPQDPNVSRRGRRPMQLLWMVQMWAWMVACGAAGWSLVWWRIVIAPLSFSGATLLVYWIAAARRTRPPASLPRRSGWYQPAAPSKLLVQASRIQF